MKTIEIKGSTGCSRILVNETFNNLPVYTGDKRIIFITDPNVKAFYKDFFKEKDVIEIGTGETIKTLQTVEYIYHRLVETEADRSCFIVGVGGGIVCDIAGFAASTYMRGLPFGYVSSSLLSQVDASVGGKTGVNFLGFKNMIGVFQQPRFVICDLSLLKTLPHKELINGCAEIIKSAAVADSDFFSFLETHYSDVLNLDMSVLEQVVHRSIQIKTAIVEKDETEKNERRKLNFGHTIGHALEKAASIPHGEAVSIGMVFAANLSVRRKLLRPDEAERIKNLGEHFQLPTYLNTDTNALINALRKDKKREGRNIHFVLLKSIGEAAVEEIPVNHLEDLIHDLYLPGETQR